MRVKFETIDTTFLKMRLKMDFAGTIKHLFSSCNHALNAVARTLVNKLCKLRNQSFYNIWAFI